MNAEAPRVVEWSWGTIEVEGIGRLRDAKLFPGGGRGWDWRETGTRHDPGIQVSDVEELVVAGAVDIVLSRGVHSRLLVPGETVSWLEQQGLTVHVAPTAEAIALYDALRLVGATGALLHSTC